MTTPIGTAHDAERSAPRLPPLRWYVASTQRRRIVLGATASYVPWGAVHAREVGSLTSLCGMASTTWHMFFDRPFNAADPVSCRECCSAVAIADTGRAVRS